MVYATRSFTSSDDKLRCPCSKCVNNKLLSPDDVNYHLLHFGIMQRLWMKFLLNLWWKMETRGETNLRQLVHDTY
ncbi:Rho1 guanine nucleotide exchange factor TUS1, partial [Bienertia sinuspersici]